MIVDATTLDSDAKGLCGDEDFSVRALVSWARPNRN
jgi:hypothetical protein